MPDSIQTKVFYDDNLTSVDVKLLEVISKETVTGAKRFDYRKLAVQVGVKSWDTVARHIGRLIRTGLIHVDYNVSGIELTDRGKEILHTDKTP